MKIGTATINESQHEWCKRFAAMVEKDSGGRIKGQIYPASQLGSIPREIEGVQFGSIQVFVGPPEFLAGVDQRYEIVSSPGLVDNLAHEVRMVTRSRVAKADVLVRRRQGYSRQRAVYRAAVVGDRPDADPSPCRLQGQEAARARRPTCRKTWSNRLGASPVAMTLGDVLPALQQGTIDGSIAAMTIYTTMHFWDAAKYVTEINQPFIFSMAFVSKKWFDALPKDLQSIIDTDAGKAAAEVNPWEVAFFAKQREIFAQHGELISLPPAEQAAMMKQLRAVGAAVAKRKPALEKAYNVFAAVAKRTEQ